ncbi:MAG: Wadjet anti-phage system protein JetD domain-containing protein [Endozoicomonas sp.]|uniref:Wadjet anti-phage system protein JetD domain-containing protein n=1 Tax=Endozoicomonas sp. TaxID=1892382 RepID=UPI003D9BA53B
MPDYPIDEAAPIAKSLLEHSKVTLRRKMPNFGQWLIDNNLINQATKYDYDLTPSGESSLRPYMVKNYGENWDSPIDSKEERRASFLKNRLVNDLPAQLHHRVAQAVWTGDSKSSTRSHPDNITAVSCDTLRIRTAEAAVFHFTDWSIHAENSMHTMGELIFNQRAVDQFTALETNKPLHIMTIENPGAWDTLPLLPRVLYVYVPGNNQSIATEWLQKLDQFSWSHFGDLDQKGLKIAKQLSRNLNEKLELFLPAWWGEYIDLYSLKTGKSWNTTSYRKLLTQFPILIELQNKQLRLEQEAIMLDKLFLASLKQHIKSFFKDR